MVDNDIEGRAADAGTVDPTEQMVSAMKAYERLGWLANELLYTPVSGKGAVQQSNEIREKYSKLIVQIPEEMRDSLPFVGQVEDGLRKRLGPVASV